MWLLAVVYFFQGLVVDGQKTVSLFALMDLIPAWTDQDSGYLLSGIFPDCCSCGQAPESTAPITGSRRT